MLWSFHEAIRASFSPLNKLWAMVPNTCYTGVNSRTPRFYCLFIHSDQLSHLMYWIIFRTRKWYEILQHKYAEPPKMRYVLNLLGEFLIHLMRLTTRLKSKVKQRKSSQIGKEDRFASQILCLYNKICRAPAFTHICFIYLHVPTWGFSRWNALPSSSYDVSHSQFLTARACKHFLSSFFDEHRTRLSHWGLWVYSFAEIW